MTIRDKVGTELTYLEPSIKFLSENYTPVNSLFWLIHTVYAEEMYDRFSDLLNSGRLDEVILSGSLITELDLSPMQSIGTNDLYEFYLVTHTDNSIRLIIILNEGDAWSGPPELAFHSKPIQTQTTWDELIAKYPQGEALTVSTYR